MPHLAPLSWALAPAIFWLLLLTLSSSLWWHQTPLFPSSAYTHSHTFTPWIWK